MRGVGVVGRRSPLQVSQLVDSTFYKHTTWGRDVQSWVKPLHDHHNHHHHHHHHGLWKTETQSQPTQEGLRGGVGGGGVDGSGSWARGLEGLIKTVVIHSVLCGLCQQLETNLAHGLWKSAELRTWFGSRSQQTDAETHRCCPAR